MSGVSSVFLRTEGTNVLLVKGTAHTEMKMTRARITRITSASFDVGRLKNPEEGSDGQID